MAQVRAEPFTEAWLEDLASAARGARVDDGLDLVIQQVVLADDGAELAYTVRIHAGVVRVEPGRAPDASLSFTQDRATATAIWHGALSAQAAFMAGRLRVGGDLHAALRALPHLGALDHVFAPARPTPSP